MIFAANCHDPKGESNGKNLGIGCNKFTFLQPLEFTFWVLFEESFAK